MKIKLAAIKIRWYILVVGVLVAAVTFGELIIPNTFTTGQVASAAQVNANFDAVKAEVDGKIDEIINGPLITATEAPTGTVSLGIAANTITAGHIAAGAVGTSELAANSVGSPQLGANSVGLSEMQDNAVGSAEIVNGSITGSDIGANTVGSSNIIDNSLVAADIAANAVGASELATNAVTAVDTLDEAGFEGNISASSYNIAST